MSIPNPWRPIKSYRKEWPHTVDVWMTVHASAMSMGWGDAFRVIDSYRKNEKWFHFWEGREQELAAHYITHWMPTPRAPQKRARP